MLIRSAASGDLRNVVKSINALPCDYNGTCTVVINDINRYVAARNLLFLCMLCDTTGPSPEETAEAVVHLWYSAALTQNQSTYLGFWMKRLFDRALPDDAPCIIDTPSLRSTSDVRFLYPRSTTKLGKAILGSSYSWSQAKEDMVAICFAASRVDYRERRLANLRPRHRVAHIYWMRSGMVLPLGESIHNVTQPNRSDVLHAVTSTHDESLTLKLNIAFSSPPKPSISSSTTHAPSQRGIHWRLRRHDNASISPRATSTEGCSST